ncbi:hypothetical protein K431DRAFT_308399 [Polychaeton citri CBS 116435]|uniref:Uncharacterized protein n=1 Tax=Polychaeton citri CBS 116435 TaxID=1314669 RepID=A0A9P4Q0G6_9PEZI|nr:hypothetical protein K431DRAFT_308399 [Polychaeton citri CBS 116435]
MCSRYVFMITKYGVDYNKLEGERCDYYKHSNRPNCYVLHISFASYARHVKRLYYKYKRAYTRAGNTTACRGIDSSLRYIANYIAPKNRVDRDNPPKSSDREDYNSSNDGGTTLRPRYDN